MSSDCYISVQVPFNVDDMSSFSDIAEKYLHYAFVDGELVIEKHYRNFLNDISTGYSYVGCGTKGDVFHWGQVGNYVDIDKFVEHFSVFADEVLKDNKAVLSFNKFLILFQRPDGNVTAYSVGLDGDTRPYYIKTTKMKIEKFELPFTFGVV